VLLPINAQPDTALKRDANITRMINVIQDNLQLAILANQQMLAKSLPAKFNLIFLSNASTMTKAATMEKNALQILATSKPENASTPKSLITSAHPLLHLAKTILTVPLGVLLKVFLANVQ
jgi:hypothetical protein